jgi:hypothetical protein
VVLLLLLVGEVPHSRSARACCTKHQGREGGERAGVVVMTTTTTKK